MDSEKAVSGKIDVTQMTGMSISEASSVIWPFRGIRKPIGILVEQGEITVRDLAWASKESYDARLKQAAKTILFSQVFSEKLGEPIKPAKSIEGDSYTAYQRRISIANGSLALGIIIGIGIVFITILGLVQFQKSFAEYLEPYKDLINNIFGYTLLFIIPLILLWIVNHYANLSEQYSIGESTEAQSLDSFRSLLYEPWTIIRSFEFPYKKWGDIDLIIVGTGGIWAIEVKGYTSRVRNVRDTWHYKNKFGWFKLSKHPGKQARRNAARLKLFLDGQGINVGWVEPVVLWAGESKNLTVENPETLVWNISDIPELKDFWLKQRLSGNQIALVVNVLQEAINQVKTKHKKK